MAEFDIGVLLGTQSDQIFDEYVDLHPGAKRLRRLWVERCNCGFPECYRTGLQEIGWMVHDDAVLVLAFLDQLRGFEPMAFEEFDAALLKLYDTSAVKHGSTRMRLR